jgi:ADP-dependent phosphofructokinase/glucokinase
MSHPKHVELFAGNKILYKKVSSCWNFLKLIHDARTDEHKKLNYILTATRNLGFQKAAESPLHVKCGKVTS